MKSAGIAQSREHREKPLGSRPRSRRSQVSSPAPRSTLRAFCYASGLIAFGETVPDGALAIAIGPAKKVRDFVEVHARHGYRSQVVNGRLTKIPGTDCLLVPGVPETADEAGKLSKLEAWLDWIGRSPPRGIVVM